MDIGTAIAAVGAATTTAKKLFELSKLLEHAELKSTIAELMNELADANIQLANLKVEVAALTARQNAINSTLENERPKLKWGCYVFEGEEGLYCPNCYDNKGVKRLATRVGTQFRRCVSCKTVIGAG